MKDEITELRIKIAQLSGDHPRRHGVYAVRVCVCVTTAAAQRDLPGSTPLNVHVHTQTIAVPPLPLLPYPPTRPYPPDPPPLAPYFIAGDQGRGRLRRRDRRQRQRPEVKHTRTYTRAHTLTHTYTH